MSLEEELLDCFYEESSELLQEMETALLALDPSQPDRSRIDAAFRAVHSIKGNCGPFGFHELADFAHLSESLLEDIRDGSRRLTAEAVEALLATGDCLRETISALHHHATPSWARMEQVTERLHALLGSPGPAWPEATPAEAPRPRDWRIRFLPGPGLLRSGNEPLRILRELASLGTLEARALTDRVPALEALDPEACHLGWELRLRAPAAEARIREVFSWVEDESEIEIVPHPDGSPSAVAQEVRGPNSIRVSTEKIDALLDMVGELVITQSMLSEAGRGEAAPPRALDDAIYQLQRNINELQNSVMRIRMLPIRMTFDRLPRLVHELARVLEKTVDLEISGGQTELDKAILERLFDPLVHLVRNAVDHGIEPPGIRRAAGKPPQGRVCVRAYQDSGNIVVEVEDDGAGLDAAAIREHALRRGLLAPDAEAVGLTELIFRPGFSTVEQVSDISGRGVGLDVVQRNIGELGGFIRVDSQRDRGTTFSVRLPLTRAIVDGQLVRVGGQVFVLPSLAVVEFRKAHKGCLLRMPDGARLYRLDDQALPVLHLADVLGLRKERPEALLAVVEYGGGRAGFFVDELLGEQQVVIKNVADNYARVPAVAGATVLGDGRVALILDLAGLVGLAERRSKTAPKPPAAASPYAQAGGTG